MQTDAPEYVEISTGSSPIASIIWLHGLGADGHDFAPIVEELQLPCAVRFVLPHAPVMPVTINGGYAMRAWYDILGQDITSRQDEPGIRASQALLKNLIAREIQRGIPAQRILLVGFSQGGAIVLHTGLRHEEKLAGILALSTYLPLQEALAMEQHASNLDTPIFMAHGGRDDIIPLASALKSRDCMIAFGHAVEWHEYPMPHSVCLEEIDDIRHFICRTLGVQTKPLSPHQD